MVMTDIVLSPVVESDHPDRFRSRPNAAATAVRFVLLRGWMFHPGRSR
jgi:hypothetical protein